jgi:GT2 family glycosyltransferase
VKFAKTSVFIRYIRVVNKIDRDMPFLHTIVLGYGRFKHTSQRCLESLLPIPDAVEVRIFDNGSPDDSPQLQTQFVGNHPAIRSTIHPSNLGFAGGMNAAVELLDTPCEWLMLLGNDTIFHPHAFTKLVQAMHQVPPEIGILGPMTNFAGTAQGLQTLGSSPEEAFSRWDQLPQIEDVLWSPLYRADFFCVAIRKSVWDELQGLDRSYGRGYYEDFDFCMRAKEKGYGCAMIENAFVFHQGSASFKHDPHQSELIKKNKKHFVQQFPHAELRHRRLDHFKTMEWYLQPQDSKPMQSLVRQLVQLRLESLVIDLPKSLIKKWLWQRRIRSFNHHFQKFT